MGKTIMVSSHILPELADICNKVGIIERGELLVNADVADVMKQVRQRTLLNVGVVGRSGGGRAALRRQAERREGRLDRRRRHGHAGARTSTDYSDLPTPSIDAGYKLTLFQEDEINLETAFMALTKGITA